MTICAKLFAAARQVVGGESIEVQLHDGATVADLRQALAATHPELQALLPHAAFAVDEEYAPDTQKLNEQQSVACIPPVSGG
ncbi:MAG: MoaD/ThiS family protein [Pirellulales bacterium]|nr:MoaD/ThiS family protein [Pirellulales bacterium]